jgi:hypothetical protein
MGARGGILGPGAIGLVAKTLVLRRRVSAFRRLCNVATLQSPGHYASRTRALPFYVLHLSSSSICLHLASVFI